MDFQYVYFVSIFTIILILSNKNALILLSENMFDYIVRLLVWAVDGGAKVSLHPVCIEFTYLHINRMYMYIYLSVNIQC